MYFVHAEDGVYSFTNKDEMIEHIQDNIEDGNYRTEDFDVYKGFLLTVQVMTGRPQVIVGE